MGSSYRENNYGNFLNLIVLVQKPRIVVECGVLNGYSTRYIAEALRFNNIANGIKSGFFAFDLFEDYKYKHKEFAEIKKVFAFENIGVRLYKQDAFEASKCFEDNEVDFLHFDISNDGYKLTKMLNEWGSKINPLGIIAFEGGSKERDEGWIKKYNKKPIRPELKKIEGWNYKVYEEFPGLTLLWKKQKQ